MRTLVVPDAREDPSWQGERRLLSLPLGSGLVGFSFHDGERDHPRVTVRGESVISRVEYRWELEFAYDEPSQAYASSSYRLDRPGLAAERPTTAAYSRLRAQLDEAAAAVDLFIARNGDHVRERYLLALESQAYYLELDVGRKADELEEKLAELAAVQRKLTSASGTASIVPGRRSRPSALAAVSTRDLA
jgi:hypothetical protein